MKKNQKQRPKAQFLIGIDEVGRGPIAGPVAVGAFIFLKDSKSAVVRRLFRGVRESKQLSEDEREVWFERLLAAQDAGLVDFAVTFVSEKVIDSKGLSYTIKFALESSLRELVEKIGGPVEPENFLVLLDGGLHAPADFVHQKTIIKGDAKEPVIALASICAKVLRDRRMRLHAKKYPQYGFDIHKGYGTRGHYAAIRKHGLSPLHRKSFLSRIAR